MKYCSVRKLFRTSFISEFSLSPMTKLNKSRIKWLVKQVTKEGKTPSQVAPVYNLTIRRVQQLVRAYRMSGTMPELNKARRPKTTLSNEQKEAIDSVFNRTKLSARLLYYELKAKGIHVPKNKLYEHLKSKGYVTPNPNKQKKRKRCRYEREHSGSLIHGDGHRASENHPYCLLWMDDASRKILSGCETMNPLTNDHSIRTCKEAIKKAKEYNIFIKQANTDRGTEFYSNKKEKNLGSKSKFEIFLESEGIEHIPSRVNNPQTNGKLERQWLEYDRHRWRFDNLQEYIDWYNNRMHGALRLEWAETPNQAFLRKMPPESLIGLVFKNAK